MKSLRTRRAAAGVALIVSVSAAALSAWPARSLIEQSMVWHMVVQMPMLVLGGWLLASASSGGRSLKALEAWNQFGLTGFVGSQITLAYWMLPLAVDRAVVLPSADVLKLLTLLACGALLRHSVQRSPTVVQLFFVGSAVSMLLTAGVTLAVTDRRLCNAYSLDSQVNAGLGVMALGAALAGAWTWGVIRRSRTVAHCARQSTGR
jgi:hypothetical protein